MADLVPDPATRPTPDGYLPDLVRTVDKVAVAEVFYAGARVGLDGFDAWYRQFTAPPLPPEPPEGAVCRGDRTDLWHREDLSPEASTWWLHGTHYRYRQALEAGLDPSRRLVELPDPGNEDAMSAWQMAAIDAFNDRLGVGAVCASDFANALRALTERGQPDRRYPPEPTPEEWAAHNLEPDETPALRERRDQITREQT